MAQVSLSSGSVARPYRSPWGAFPVKHMIPVSSNAAIHVGRQLSLLGGGSTNGGEVAPSSNATFNLVGLSGSSMAAGSSATRNSPIPVYEANPNVEFVAFTIGDAVGSSHIGARKALHWDSTLGIAVVDLATSTGSDARVVITGVPGVNGVTGLKGELGDSGAQVTFRFITNLAGVNGSTIVSSTPLLAFYS